VYLQPVIQEKFNNEILQQMLPLMDDVANPRFVLLMTSTVQNSADLSCFRVQTHCAAALVNFMEDAERHQVQPFLDNLVSKLVGLLNSNKTYVQEQVITTIATVADCSAESFVKVLLKLNGSFTSKD
jgi:hypothetical protein